MKADDAFLRRMVQTIETGTADPEDNTAQSTMLEIIFTSLFASLLFWRDIVETLKHISGAFKVKMSLKFLKLSWSFIVI